MASIDPTRDAKSEDTAPLTPLADPETATAGDEAEEVKETEEQEVWSGAPALRAGVGRLAGGVVLALVLSILAALSELGWLSIIAWGVCGVALVWGAQRCFWPRYSHDYRLTSQRLFITRGLIFRTTDQTELIRVDDIRVRQGPIQRAMGVGDVIVLSTDLTDQECVLHGIESPGKVGEEIRRYTRERRKRSSFVKRL